MSRTFVMSLLCAALAGQAGPACAPSAPRPDGARVERVLFIGNSLTYVNDLPATLAGLGRAGGHDIQVRTVAAPNLALIDHLDQGTAAAEAIRSGPWDVVVLQQGPTTRRIDADTLALAVRRFDVMAKAAGARTAVMMVWPPSARATAFDSVAASCRRAAGEVAGGRCIPVGEAWRAALAVRPPVAVYGPDGFHPSPTGTYLAALVLYESVTGADARLLPARATTGGAPGPDEATVRTLRRLAHEANQTAAAGP